MKFEAEFAGCIEDIGIDPMFYYYTTPSQKAFARNVARNEYTKISVDATGIVVLLPNECTISERTVKNETSFLIDKDYH